MTSVAFLKATLTPMVAPAGAVSGTCCDTNSAAVETTIVAAGVSSPNVPCVCDSIRNWNGAVAANPHDSGLTTNANVTSSPGNTSWGLASVALPADVAPGATVTFAFDVTIPTVVGPYNFQWQMTGPGSAPFGQASPPTPVNVVAAGPPNYQGLWWAAPAGRESGWGIDLAHQGDVIFASWFTYDASGKGLWLASYVNQVAKMTSP